MKKAFVKPTIVRRGKPRPHASSCSRAGCQGK